MESIHTKSASDSLDHLPQVCTANSSSMRYLYVLYQIKQSMELNTLVPTADALNRPHPYSPAGPSTQLDTNIMREFPAQVRHQFSDYRRYNPNAPFSQAEQISTHNISSSSVKDPLVHVHDAILSRRLILNALSPHR
jgi:hypothetical protein